MFVASDSPIVGAEYVGVASHAELCACPAGFSGTSCESCAFGFRRVDNVLLGGTCEKCQCNDNAATCDPFTGQCLGYCLNSTQGEFCDECSFNVSCFATSSFFLSFSYTCLYYVYLLFASQTQSVNLTLRCAA